MMVSHTRRAVPSLVDSVSGSPKKNRHLPLIGYKARMSILLHSRCIAVIRFMKVSSKPRLMSSFRCFLLGGRIFQYRLMALVPPLRSMARSISFMFVTRSRITSESFASAFNAESRTSISSGKSPGMNRNAPVRNRRLSVLFMVTSFN
jgi:hypothetical protein